MPIFSRGRGLATAAGQSSFQAPPLRRMDMIAMVLRSMIPLWHRRLSEAPSAVMVLIGSSDGICAKSSGIEEDVEIVWGTVSLTNGLSPWRPEANSTARTSPVPASLPRWTRPSQRCERAAKAVEYRGVTIALVCRAFGVSETRYRYSRLQTLK